MSKNIVAIDLGSNAIRILKIDCQSKKKLGTFHKTVKTADGLAKTGLISYASLDRIIQAINEAKGQINFSNSIIKAVTTEAIRQAKNSKEILEAIEKNTEITFEIISGDDEAKYALNATQNRLKLLNESAKSFMIADIGGGSTELIFYYPNITISKSFKIGIVTLTQSFDSLSAISNAIPALMHEMKLFTKEVYYKYGRVEKFISTAGTPTTVASMKLGMRYDNYNPEKINGTILSRSDLVKQLKRLLSMSEEERTKSVGVGREDLIVSGILMFEEIFNIGGFNSTIVIDDGIREGIAFSECQKLELIK